LGQGVYKGFGVATSLVDTAMILIRKVLAEVTNGIANLDVSI
jgi:hypothetical protein